jgi:hypothetical protein
MKYDDGIIRRRIADHHVRESAKVRRKTVCEVNEAIDRWADSTITDKTTKHTLALELARLDALQEVFRKHALDGDVQCGAVVRKTIERRCAMLGLHTPRTAVLQIVEQARPKKTSADRIERVLNELLEEQKKKCVTNALSATAISTAPAPARPAAVRI